MQTDKLRLSGQVADKGKSVHCFWHQIPAAACSGAGAGAGQRRWGLWRDVGLKMYKEDGT